MNEPTALPGGEALAFGGVQIFFGTPDIAVAPFDADGLPDTNFSGDGLSTIAIPGANYASGIHDGVQPSGEIIVPAQADV